MKIRRKRHIRFDRLALILILLGLMLLALYKGTLLIVDYFNTPEEVIGETNDEVPDHDDCFSCSISSRDDSSTDSNVEPALINLGEFRLTGYCNCEKCCGQWSGGPCYNGEMPEAEWTIAVDPDVIPINSIVVINGHYYKACDTGSAINENRIDIYCNSHQECFSDFCNGYADVYLVNY